MYERPEKEPHIDIGNLFKLLFRPRKAFEDLYDHTSSTQGWVLAILFIIISAVVAGLFMMWFLEDSGLSDEVLDRIPSGSFLWISQVLGVVMNLVVFYVVAWLISNFLKDPRRGMRPSLKKTIGLMGYAKFPALIIGILIAMVTPAYTVASIEFSLESENLEPGELPEGFGEFCNQGLIYFGLILMVFLWGIWVHSHAVSVANDTKLGTAFTWTLVAWIIGGVISVIFGVAMVAIGLAGTSF